MRSHRNRADYDIDRAFDHIDAVLRVQIARRIIQDLDAARTEPTRTRIAEAMKIYERDVLRDVTWKP